MVYHVLIEVNIVWKINVALVQVHATLLGVFAEHDVVVAHDESVGVEVEKAVDKEHVDLRHYLYTIICSVRINEIQDDWDELKKSKDGKEEDLEDDINVE